MDLELRIMFTFMGNVMIVKDPWPHIIEDNFLEPEMYKFLVSLIKYDKKRYKTIWCAEKHKKDYYERLASKQRYDGYNHFDGEIYSVYAKYSIPYSKEIMDILCYAQDKLVERMMMLMPERLDNVKTTHAYILNENMYDVIIDLFDSKGIHNSPSWNGSDPNRLNIDYRYATDLSPNYRVYGVWPMLAKQAAGISDLDGNFHEIVMIHLNLQRHAEISENS